MFVVNGLAVTKRLIDGPQVQDRQPSARRDRTLRRLLPGIRFAATSALADRKQSGGFRPHVRFASTFAAGEPLGHPPGDNSLMSASRPSPLTRTGNYGDNRIRTGDPLLAKQVLYQLSYVPRNHVPLGTRPRRGRSLVGQGGLEPPTPRLSSVCSNQLSY